MGSRFHIACLAVVACLAGLATWLAAGAASAQADDPAPHDHVKDFGAIVEFVTTSYPAAGSLNRSAGIAYSYIIRELQWQPGQTVRICFNLRDDAAYQASGVLVERIVALAQNWTRPGGANLKLDFGPANARTRCSYNDGIEIRIALEPGQHRWSMIGRFRPDNDRNQPTMNLYFSQLELMPNTSMSWRFDYEVQHEFGHALGFIHEHQGGSCDSEIRLADLEALYGVEFVTRNYRNWRTALNGVIPGNLALGVNTAFCARSIMTYPIEERYLFQGANSRCYAPRVTQLADCDHQSVTLAYPILPASTASVPALRSANAVALSAMRLAANSRSRSERQVLSQGAAAMQMYEAPQSNLASQLARLVEIARDEASAVFDFNVRRVLHPDALSVSGVTAAETRLSPDEQARLSRAIFFFAGRTIQPRGSP